jgi:hypothetical protein
VTDISPPHGIRGSQTEDLVHGEDHQIQIDFGARIVQRVGINATVPVNFDGQESNTITKHRAYGTLLSSSRPEDASRRHFNRTAGNTIQPLLTPARTNVIPRQAVRIGFCRERQRCGTKGRHDYWIGKAVRATIANVDSCTFLDPDDPY